MRSRDDTVLTPPTPTQTPTTSQHKSFITMEEFITDVERNDLSMENYIADVEANGLTMESYIAECEAELSKDNYIARWDD